MNKTNKHKGFTLLEVMVVLSISTLVVGLAYKAWSGFFTITLMDQKKNRQRESLSILLPSLTRNLKANPNWYLASKDSLLYQSKTPHNTQGITEWNRVILTDSSIIWNTPNSHLESKIFHGQFNFFKKVKSEEDAYRDSDNDSLLNLEELDLNNDYELDDNEIRDVFYIELKYSTHFIVDLNSYEDLALTTWIFKRFNN